MTPTSANHSKIVNKNDSRSPTAGLSLQLGGIENTPVARDSRINDLGVDSSSTIQGQTKHPNVGVGRQFPKWDAQQVLGRLAIRR